MNNFNNGTIFPRRCHGFTMVEALIAFVVLAVGLLALLSFHGATQRTNAEAKTQAEAVALADSKLQELESYLTSSDDRLDEATTTETVSGLLAAYTLSWTVADIDGDASRKLATVNVGWTDRDSNAQQVELTSEIYFRAPTDTVENFMTVVQGTKDLGAGGVDWGVDNPDVPGDGTDPVDPVDPVGPVDPVDPNPDPVVTTYTLIISGTLSGASGAQFQDADGFEDVSADPELLYPTTCSYTKETFSCTAQYNSNSPGWTGDVVLKSNKNMYRSGSGSCSGATKTLSISFDGISQNQTLSIIAC